MAVQFPACRHSAATTGRELRRLRPRSNRRQCSHRTCGLSMACFPFRSKPSDLRMLTARAIVPLPPVTSGGTKLTTIREYDEATDGEGDPMSPDGEALLRAVLDAPADDLPRLAYADWLDEQGEGDHAQFIRCQLRLAQIGHRPGCGNRSCPCSRLSRRARELSRDGDPSNALVRAGKASAERHPRGDVPVSPGVRRAGPPDAG